MRIQSLTTLDWSPADRRFSSSVIMRCPTLISKILRARIANCMSLLWVSACARMMRSILAVWPQVSDTRITGVLTKRCDTTTRSTASLNSALMASHNGFHFAEVSSVTPSTFRTASSSSEDLVMLTSFRSSHSRHRLIIYSSMGSVMKSTS